MKRILTVFAALSAVLELYSGVPVRLDLCGRDDGVKLEQCSVSDNLNGGYAGYLKKDREYMFIATAKRSDRKDFVLYTVSFVPADSGTVKVTFKAGFSSKDSVSRVVVDALEVNGGAAVNTSFEDVEDGLPVGWNGKGRISSDAAAGKNSISVNYRESLSQYIHVVGGQRVTIRFKSRSEGVVK